MFGKEKIQVLESKIRELTQKLEKASGEKEGLKQELEKARGRIRDLEEKINSSEIEESRKKLETSRAEFEGLKEMYDRKNREFDNSREEREQEFARHAAVQRYNLENEIAENREANQQFVSRTVRTFSESYNYYLNQIRLLMDALGEVATEAGETLFSDPQADLKGRIGQKMADKLKAETDPLRKNNGDLILIGSMEEEKEPEASEAERESAEEENPEAAEAAEGAPEEAPPASEAAEAEPDAEA